MTNYYTSDWHLTNLGSYANKLLEKINNKVKEDDSLYVLGNLSMFDASEEVEQTFDFINQIKCNNIYICIGNHDSANLIAALLDHPKIKEITDVKVVKDIAFTCTVSIALNHFPIIDYHLKGGPTMMLHGHSHGLMGIKLPDLFDVSVDNQDYEPMTIEELLSKYYGDNANPYTGYMEHVRAFKNDFANFMKKHNR